jgi:hypothetical protein
MVIYMSVCLSLEVKVVACQMAVIDTGRCRYGRRVRTTLAFVNRQRPSVKNPIISSVLDLVQMAESTKFSGRTGQPT